MGLKRKYDGLKGRGREGRIIVAIEFMRAVLGDEGLAGRPFGIDIDSVVKGGPFGEIGGGHGFKGDIQAILERIDFQREIRIFLNGPAELMGSKDHIGNAFFIFDGPIKRDMGDGQLTYFRLTA